MTREQPKIIKCPNCGNVQFAYKEWCPDCGAKMDCDVDFIKGGDKDVCSAYNQE